MYKRYYDGYNTYPRSTADYSGEVIIPQDSEDSTKTAEAEEILSSPEVSHTSDAPEIEFTVQDGDTAVASFNRGKSVSSGNLIRIFDDISIDDIILFGVILLVLKDSGDDPLLLIILAVIFISGLIDKD